MLWPLADHARRLHPSGAHVRHPTRHGVPHLLHPVLVTGLKAWHLRPASDFFPKLNFEAAMRAIPDGAPARWSRPPPAPA